ncbi:hypothetical protein E4U42_003153 [Claviceps africana]|uniref:C2H2-type domain-containing protein n=1 Tax=Claviceps africana TaxID=83212 RepID=A0A8K0J7Q0_9HYPO|nr:hypothetical protein E4U42_003153 [Claviceps africana]
MDSQEFDMQTLEYILERHYGASSPYVPLSEASSRSTPAYDYTDSSSQACPSDLENASLHDSPMPVSPTPNNLYPSLQSAASSRSIPSPNHTQLPPAVASLSRSPKPNSDASAPSPPTSPKARRAKSSSSSPPPPPSCSLAPSGRDYPVCCLYPGCNAKPFKRRADLDRHYKHRHAADAQKVSFSCDYPRCSRRKDPFYRLDHFRDHLREFHKEDIEKRGGSVDRDWLGDRRVSSTWWRCCKCLSRIYIEHNGYECPGCKTSCQAKRKEVRRRS